MTNGGAELVDWFSGWWMQRGLGWGLPTRPRWLAALLFSPRQPSLVTIGGASLCSVWSTENLIIQANVACTASCIFTHKNLFPLTGGMTRPLRHSRCRIPSPGTGGETKASMTERPRRRDCELCWFAWLWEKRDEFSKLYVVSWNETSTFISDLINQA